MTSAARRPHSESPKSRHKQKHKQRQWWRWSISIWRSSSFSCSTRVSSEWQQRQRRRSPLLASRLTANTVFIMLIGTWLIACGNNQSYGKTMFTAAATITTQPHTQINESTATATATASASRNLRQVALERVADTSRVGNVTRQYSGDVFHARDGRKCDVDTCVGLSSGTAGLTGDKSAENEPTEEQATRDGGGGNVADDCKCQCFPHMTVFREDLNICVDDIHECILAPFVSGSSTEKIPFVFLPLYGQIIHPSKEISFAGVDTPICAVSSSQYLTRNGWSELRNPLDSDVPFRLFRDEGRTFLQWLGDPELRHRMQGRIVLVHLMCRDMVAARVIAGNIKSGSIAKTDPKTKPKIFTPCVAFRVVGTPVKFTNNVTEVSFQSEASSESVTAVDGLSTRAFITIAVCSLLLGLIYVASVFLYIHMKKRKSGRHSADGGSSTGTSTKTNDCERNFPKNDQVIFGPGVSRGVVTGRSLAMNGGPSSPANSELCIVKSNPLLKHLAALSDHSGFTSDESNTNSVFDDEHQHPHHHHHHVQTDGDSSNENQVPVMIHPAKFQRCSELDGSISQDNECHPGENVSIVEDMTQEEKLENMKAIVNGTMRRKLYFNPAYFEPHLLMSPPPAAVEFLTKIREVITIAKYKMASKRFQPSLNGIPEEFNGHTIDARTLGHTNISRHSSMLSLKRDNSRKKQCAGCPGCDRAKPTEIQTVASNCRNCGDKRNTIRKWLEGVSSNENLTLLKGDDGEPTDSNLRTSEQMVAATDRRQTSSLHSETSSSSDNDTIKANSDRSSKGSSSKRRAPPIPSGTPPKIVSVHNKTLLNDPMNVREKIYQPAAMRCGGSPHNDLYGSEIYNNPQFQLAASPQLSARSSTQSTRSGRRRRIEVLDQYANPKPIDLRHIEMMRNMPDMVYEALAKDYTSRGDCGTINGYHVPTPDYNDDHDECGSSSSSPPLPPPAPTGTPQYDSVDERFVPTPDYNTGGRRPAKPCPPDSPIYARKSPHFLIVDYETDSLERCSDKHRGGSSSGGGGGARTATPPTSTSESSCQPSPSLSTALPMEEEVEIRNALYDRVEGFRKDTESIATEKLMAEWRRVYAAKQTKIMYNTPFEGSMTIEVEHSPQDTDLSTDSDQFEPDTLDRKPKRTPPVASHQKLTADKASIEKLPVAIKKSHYQDNINAWSQHLQKSIEFMNHFDDKVRYSSLEDMTSLPDLNHLRRAANGTPQKLIVAPTATLLTASDEQLDRKFGSLRDIYVAKTQKQLLLQRGSAARSVDFAEQGRLLTLEARHSKRQRRTTAVEERCHPPDVVPHDVKRKPADSHYDRPKAPPVQVNLQPQSQPKPQQVGVSCDETTSDGSESTECTGVSDTQVNSEFEIETGLISGGVGGGGKAIIHAPNERYVTETNGFFVNQLAANRGNSGCGGVGGGGGGGGGTTKYRAPQPSENNVLTTHQMQHFASHSAPRASSRCTAPSAVIATRSLRHRNDPRQMVTATKVFRVEIDTPTHGMQIAMGLRDRVKKSKDLKNAWRRFVSMATAKFNNGPKEMGNSDNDNDNEHDHEHEHEHENDNTSAAKHNDFLIDTLPPMNANAKIESDSGYASAASTESHIRNKKLYDRLSFATTRLAEDIKEEPTPEAGNADDKSPAANFVLEIKDAIVVNVYSDGDEMNGAQDEQDEYSSSGLSSDEQETDEEYSVEDMNAESGAESVETHSVMFKQLKNCN